MKLRENVSNIRAIQKALKSVKKQAEESVSITILGDRKIGQNFYDVFGVSESNAVLQRIDERNSSQQNETLQHDSDITLIIVAPQASNDDLKYVAKQGMKAKHRLAIVPVRETNALLQGRLSKLLEIPLNDVLFIALENHDEIRSKLIPKIVVILHNKEISLAAQLPGFRDHISSKLIKKAAIQNGFLGVAIFLPGADMAAMTLNQIRMVLQLTAAYNIEVSSAKLYEILSVVASGFAFRSVSRKIVEYIPVAGWAIKGSVGYYGTVAMGEVAIKYLESLESDETGNQEKGEPVDDMGTDRTTSEERRKTQSIH